ncbi:hypothetical protein EUTSA_v10009973mg [Eutrema salsugineum]|uniref:Pectinesterase inhibitor domain-containing protein n=1 Tax=Eutrema salsugineum TaxID=72664 RepID=V4KWG8_EUTSA|nr:hypothetical protein EUTSA_v10009973mg [Eutrema salsugineum]
MVAYLKKNVLLVFIVAILFLVVSSDARLSMMVTKTEIDSICTSKYINSSHCFEVLNSIPKIAKLDFPGLTKVLISYQSLAISKTLKQIKLLERNTTDWKTINLCGRLYEGALHDNDRSLGFLAAKDYDSFYYRISGVSINIATCNDELKTMKPIPQFLIMESTVIDNIVLMIERILECYITKETVKC